MSEQLKKDVIIIGAGASGLFCAMECGKRGRSVLVLDHADRACSKVLISGGGRCNFTNLNVTPDHYLSSNPHFCRSALARFTPQDMLDLVKKHKIAFYEKEAGQLFCIKSSRDIAEMLLKECREAGVEIRLRVRIEKVTGEDGFSVATERGIFRSDSLVIATGGLSYQNLGATGFGHALARHFNIPVTDVKPGLVPFLLTSRDQKNFRDLAGVSLEGAVMCEGRTFPGGILFTHRGLSGPAMLQASNAWKKGAPLVIDLLYGMDLAAVLAGERQSRTEIKNLLGRVLPKRFVETWCSLYFPSRPINQCTDKDLDRLDAHLHAWEITPSATEGFANAEVTTGGVDTNSISSKTMEARDVPGLYFIGEVLDVTGQLGGYNLHWAWASGFAAGQYA
jgi:hypothetical protein